MARPDEGKPRLFYKTIIRYEVLSEEPIPGHADLEYIAKEANEGRYVGRFLISGPWVANYVAQVRHLTIGLPGGPNDHVLMNGASMAEALYEAGSEPGFFLLDDEGNDYDENEPERDFDFEKDD